MSQRKNNILSESKKRTPDTPANKEEKKENAPFEFAPTFLGMDYFRVVYGAAFILAILMAVVYFMIEDDKM